MIACYYILCNIVCNIAHGMPMQVHKLSFLLKKKSRVFYSILIQEIDNHLGKYFCGGVENACAVY